MTGQRQRQVLGDHRSLRRGSRLGVGSLKVFKRVRERRRGLRTSELVEDRGEVCGRYRLDERPRQTGGRSVRGA